jgi:enoyl-CoA hydratase/carnithine racemase
MAPNYVSRPKFEDYKEQFKDYFIMERNNGIIQLRMHTNGGPVKWSFQAHNALGQAWHVVGNDPENEVLILTATGPYWIGESDNKAFAEEEAKGPGGQAGFDVLYYDASKIVENFLYDIDIPTIAAIPGTGGTHLETAYMSDITLCTEKCRFSDLHFAMGAVAGDGIYMLLQELLGLKRANRLMYLSTFVDAKTALECGLVSEVVPEDKLLSRAWEIAEQIMQQPREIRRLTTQIVRRPLKRLLMNDFQVHIPQEMYGMRLTDNKHNFAAVKKIRDSWETKK